MWKLLARLLGFVLPSCKELYEALVSQLIQALVRTSLDKERKYIVFAYNRLIQAYPRGERKYAAFQDELAKLRVSLVFRLTFH